ncbi:MAG: hypothetical protein ACRDMZ_04480 [Solirubrobacteraceae bacterium]
MKEFEMFTRFALVLMVVAVAVVVVSPASAVAHEPTVAEALAIADRWAARDAPGLPNYCAGGNMRLTFADQIMFDRDGAGPAEPQVLAARGVAHGWVADGAGGFRWDYAACDATIVNGLGAQQQCWTIAHELMHFVIGPEHIGPLDPRHPGAVECFAGDEDATRDAAREAHEERPLSPRTRLMDSLHGVLPALGASWQVKCTRNAARMRCRATHPRARMARSFRARIVRGSVWYGDAAPSPRRAPCRDRRADQR